jgi:peptidoglycan hydrolase-like protein with peptidoglycan-binding domain
VSAKKALVATATAVALLGGVTGCTAYAAGQDARERPATATTQAPDPGAGTTEPVATETPAADPSAGGEPSTEPAQTPTPTPTPTVDAILERGNSGGQVRELQFRLGKAGAYSGRVTGFYGPATQRGVTRFQRGHGLDVTGAVDAATLRKLRRLTPRPKHSDLYPPPPAEEKAAPVDERCRVGRVICISKSKRRLYWVIDGEVQQSMSVRFGSQFTPTREGVFSVYTKSRDHVSRLYHSSMPYAMFFSGGQAVHYSSDFAARGYAGASHGCVNTRNRAATRSLFEQVQTGDRVVVYKG